MLCSCFKFFALSGQKLTESNTPEKEGKSDLQMHLYVLLNVYFILLYCIVFYIINFLHVLLVLFLVPLLAFFQAIAILSISNNKVIWNYLSNKSS